MQQPMRVLTSQNTQEWYTPEHVIAWVTDILDGNIELDPASCKEANKIVQASVFYSAEQNGYNKQWKARTVFLNPPFDATPLWLQKLTHQYAAGNISEAIMLVNAAPGYIWFENMWRLRTVCMLRERLCFTNEDGYVYGQAKKAQTLIYFGTDDTKFATVLEPHGRILRP